MSAKQQLKTARRKAKGSRLEAKFALIWKALGGPLLEREVRFCAWRKWRSDFAHLPSKTIIEIEGGTWSGGRHTRGAGYAKDCEKYNVAQNLGWCVYRLTSDMITIKHIEPIITSIMGPNWKNEKTKYRKEIEG